MGREIRRHLVFGGLLGGVLRILRLLGFLAVFSCHRENKILIIITGYITFYFKAL